MSAVELMSVPVISTGHICQRTADLLAMRRIKATVIDWMDYGWLFVVNEDEQDDELLPVDLQTLYRWARQEGYAYLRLDQDADTVDGLPTYDW